MTTEHENDIKAVQRVRRISITSTLMDKEMFYFLLNDFDGDVMLTGVSFSDVKRTAE